MDPLRLEEMKQVPEEAHLYSFPMILNHEVLYEFTANRSFDQLKVPYTQIKKKGYYLNRVRQHDDIMKSPTDISEKERTMRQGSVLLADNHQNMLAGVRNFLTSSWKEAACNLVNNTFTMRYTTS